jgi:hypothetical protein
VTRLINSERAATGQRQAGENTPSLIPRFRAAHATVFHVRDEGLHVIDHEIDFVFTIRFRWVDGDLGRRKCEDQPALSHVNMWEAQHVAKERAIRVTIRAVDDHMGARNCGHAILSSVRLKPDTTVHPDAGLIEMSAF